MDVDPVSVALNVGGPGSTGIGYDSADAVNEKTLKTKVPMDKFPGANTTSPNLYADVTAEVATVVGAKAAIIGVGSLVCHTN